KPPRQPPAPKNSAAASTQQSGPWPPHVSCLATTCHTPRPACPRDPSRDKSGHQRDCGVRQDERSEGVMGELVQELTATNFVFRRSPENGEWLTGMMWHARLGGWLPACGHAEAGETPSQAAERETLEELGCRVRFLAAPSLPLPEGFPHSPGPAPWWVV